MLLHWGSLMIIQYNSRLMSLFNEKRSGEVRELKKEESSKASLSNSKVKQKKL